MLRSLPKLQNITVLSVAHRLHTIVDFDQVLVMESGLAGECGPPHELLADDCGLFTKLIEATGEESAAALRALAFAANQQGEPAPRVHVENNGDAAEAAPGLGCGFYFQNER